MKSIFFIKRGFFESRGYSSRMLGQSNRSLANLMTPGVSKSLKRSVHTAARDPKAKGSKQAAKAFRGLIDSGVVKRRRAYYLVKVGQLLHDGTISPGKAAEIGWTKLQIIADKVAGTNVAKLLRLALDNSAEELKGIMRQDD